MKPLFAIVLLCGGFLAGEVMAAESPIGRWNTIDEKSGKVTSVVEVYDQGGKVFGKITGLTEPNDDKGKPRICTKCPGSDKDKPVVGLVIVKDLRLDGEHYKGGTIMDPEDGKVYKAEMWLEQGKLKVRGYLALFYRTQTWVRGE
jgi:uncharacterized protein (DUF2147 family)